VLLAEFVLALSLQATGTPPPADNQAAPPAKPPPAADEGLLKKGSFAGSYLLPGTSVSVKVGGYLKLDVIHDFDAIGSEDSFDPTTIPTDGTKGENTQVQAKQTRLNLDVRTPTDLGDARIFLEVDFFGSGTTLRMRHAYATLGNLLVGQTWSTFMDEDASPPTLDFEQPIAFATVRNPQVRWTQPLTADFYGAFAIEAPNSEIEAPPVPGKSEDPYPDLTSRFRWTNPVGHVQASAFAGWARFRPDTGGKDDAFLWAFLLAANFNVWGKDQLMGQIGYGPGIARYNSGIVAAPDANGDLEGLPVMGWFVDYQHWWSDTWSSNAVWSMARVDKLSGQVAGDIRELRYGAANVVWNFLPWASAGVEYLYGMREDLDGHHGTANRVQLSFIFKLP
jgi:hypothetical protein